jgi:hypothetical protein
LAEDLAEEAGLLEGFADDFADDGLTEVPAFTDDW